MPGVSLEQTSILCETRLSNFHNSFHSRCSKSQLKYMWSYRSEGLEFAAPSTKGLPGGSVVKDPPANARDAADLGSIPGLGRYPGGENGNLLQYSCLENSMDRGAWRAPWGCKESDPAEYAHTSPFLKYGARPSFWSADQSHRQYKTLSTDHINK